MQWKSPPWIFAECRHKEHRVSRAEGHLVHLKGGHKKPVSLKGQAKEASTPRGRPSEQLPQRLSCARPTNVFGVLSDAMTLASGSIFLQNAEKGFSESLLIYDFRNPTPF
jgi:hypothetical protein